MKVQRISDLIDWTRGMHQQLAARLTDGAAQHENELAGLLSSYLADHETALEKMIQGFETQADRKALDTWVIDYLGRTPIDLQRVSATPVKDMSFDEICGSVFDVHNQAIDLYRELLGRADIPEAEELLQALL
ncbi:MAG: ATPase, partial [Pseudomonadota bacterium]